MGRAPCCDRNGLKKGPWTPEEDLKLINYIQTHGPGNWRSLPKNAGLQRCGKSCRLRWTNYLRPDIKRGRFSFEEEETIIQLHSILGNKWSAIAARLPGRTDNEIKNYWNTHIRKRLLRNGIDPVTHAPRLDFLDLSSILGSAMYSQSLLNVSNLLGTQAALLNPELLRLASTLLTLKQENTEMLLQYLQQNQQLPNNSQNLNPTCNLLQQPHAAGQFQAALIHLEGSTGCATATTSADTALMNQTTQNMACSGFVSEPYYLDYGSNPTALLSSLLPENSSMGFDSVISTTVSSSCSPTPLNSSSTFVNGSSTEDERESSSSLLKFDIPEDLDISDFFVN